MCTQESGFLEIKLVSSSIWSLVGTVKTTTILGQRRTRNYGNGGTVDILQILTIRLFSVMWRTLDGRGSYPTVEIQL